MKHSNLIFNFINISDNIIEWTEKYLDTNATKSLNYNIVDDEIVVPLLPCPTCSNRYRHINHLRRHIQFECKKEPQMVCSFCNSKFKRPDSLRRHIQQSCRNKFREGTKEEKNDHFVKYM